MRFRIEYANPTEWHVYRGTTFKGWILQSESLPNDWGFYLETSDEKGYKRIASGDFHDCVEYAQCETS